MKRLQSPLTAFLLLAFASPSMAAGDAAALASSLTQQDGRLLCVHYA
jgi:hypothetical protein